MKMFSLVIVMTMVLAGCVSVFHSEIIDTEKQAGYASGQYRDERTGNVGNVTIAGLGGSGAFDGGRAFGAGLITHSVPPTQGNPVPFARSIAMINYSKKLKRIKYDECGVVSYEFDDSPSAPHRSSAFGHQPID